MCLTVTILRWLSDSPAALYEGFVEEVPSSGPGSRALRNGPSGSFVIPGEAFPAVDVSCVERPDEVVFILSARYVRPFSFGGLVIVVCSASAMGGSNLEGVSVTFDIRNCRGR